MWVPLASSLTAKSAPFRSRFRAGTEPRASASRRKKHDPAIDMAQVGPPEDLFVGNKALGMFYAGPSCLAASGHE